MTYEEYWYKDPLIVGAFHKAEQIRQERVDYEAWLQGLYIRDAIASSIGNAFVPKGKAPMKYPETPRLTEEKIKQRKKTIEDQERETAFARAWMEQFCEAGKNWGKQ